MWIMHAAMLGLEALENEERAAYGKTGIESAYDLGDHLSSPRAGYSHHGIYVGDGLVIHYSGFSKAEASGAIEVATLEEFANGYTIAVNPHPRRQYSRIESIHRAYGRVGEDWYNLLLNNCEHFVNWCIEGSHESVQVETVLGVAISAGAAVYLTNNPQVRSFVNQRLKQAVAGTAMEKVINPMTGPVFSRSTAIAANVGAKYAPTVLTSAFVSNTSSSALSGLAAGASAGATTYVIGTGTAAAITTFVGGGAVAALAPVALPFAVAAGVGVAVKELLDWW